MKTRNKGFTISDAVAEALEVIYQGRAGACPMQIKASDLKPAMLKRLLDMGLAEHGPQIEGEKSVKFSNTGFRVWQLTCWAAKRNT